MNGIRVSVGQPTREARLHPRYDQESDILAVESEVSRKWQYGLDIDGNIVFDLDEARVLANFDLHIGRHLWQRKPNQSWPRDVVMGSLIFSTESIRKKSHHLPLHAYYDAVATILRIEFGTSQARRTVGLSQDCIALLSGDELVGFLLKLS